MGEVTCSKFIFDNSTGRVICEDTGEIVAEDIIEDEYYPFYKKTESIERFNTKPEHKQIPVKVFNDTAERSGARRLAMMIGEIVREQGLPKSVYDEAIALMKNYVEMVGGLNMVGSYKILAKAFLKLAMLRQNMLPLNIENEKEKRSGLRRAVNKIIQIMNLKPIQEFSREERVMAAIDFLAKELELPAPVYVKAVDIVRKNMSVITYGSSAYKWLAGVSIYYAACLAGYEVSLTNIMRLLYTSPSKNVSQKVRWKTFLSLNEDERIRVLKCLKLMKGSGGVWVKFSLPENKVKDLYKVAGRSKGEIAKFILSNLDKVDLSKVTAMTNKRKKIKTEEINVRLPYKDFIKLKELEVRRYEISKEDILLYMANEALKKTESVKQSAA